MNNKIYNECLKYETEESLKKPIFFYHIPKCGGTTFADLLGIIFEKSVRITGTLFENNDKGGTTAFQNFNNNKIKYLKIFEKAEFIYGHLPIAMHELIVKRFSTVVIIRDPLERSISHYLWSIARGYINKNEDVEKLFITNKLPANPIFNQFTLNNSQTNNQNTKIDLAIKNIEKIDYICKLENIFDLIKLIISKYNKPNLLFQNRQTNLNRITPPKNIIDIIKKYNLIDIKIYKELVKKNMFKNFYKQNNFGINDNYIYFSTKQGVLIDNKNMCYIKKDQIDLVKRNLTLAGYKIKTY